MKPLHAAILAGLFAIGAADSTYPSVTESPTARRRRLEELDRQEEFEKHQREERLQKSLRNSPDVYKLVRQRRAETDAWNAEVERKRKHIIVKEKQL